MTSVLVLGGTNFVGAALIDEALRRDWRVSALHRGNRPTPEGVTDLLGDRTTPEGLAALGNGEWDLVADTWSLAPRVVRDSARALAGRAGHYAYVSSCSVYGLPCPPGQDEGGTVVEGSPDAEAVDYASDKRGAELAVAEAFGERGVYARAGLILGPRENVGRLPWWLRRLARGGVVPAPGPRDLPLQYVDARDLAAWTWDAAARGLTGPYNLVSRPGHTTMGELLDTALGVTGDRATLRWVSPEQVARAGVEPWSQLPIWLPPGELHDSLQRLDVERAHATGLRCRPVAETVADTWRWLAEWGDAPLVGPRAVRHGTSPDQERRLLEVAEAGE
ncbi:NAD-dependent epimerase/dehydratase family protein [Streptomyces sp. NPDC005438]|uniref:NAD-dependent epimerase/dehydratase family protein n=1 Tax=Streptomyces sp. NPDC005438 TaxID=3156880 RepID=UPI0033A1095D